MRCWLVCALLSVSWLLACSEDPEPSETSGESSSSSSGEDGSGDEGPSGGTTGEGAACVKDEECVFGTVCEEAVCTEIPCASSADRGPQRVCAPASEDVFETVCFPRECVTDVDCAAQGLSFVCIDGLCLQEGCFSDADCPGDLTCDVVLGACR